MEYLYHFSNFNFIRYEFFPGHKPWQKFVLRVACANQEVRYLRCDGRSFVLSNVQLTRGSSGQGVVARRTFEDHHDTCVAMERNNDHPDSRRGQAPGLTRRPPQQPRETITQHDELIRHIKEAWNQLPFSTVASLNGTHMFCKSQGVQLKSTHTDDWILVWKDYENTVTLIAAGKGITEKTLWCLLDLVFNSFLLFVNFDEIQKNKNFERIKREAKSYMPIVDKLLEYCESELLGYSDCVLATENSHVLQRLNEFSVQFGSLFCAVVVNQKLAAATEGWWDLDVVDRKLLVLMLNVSNSLQKDVAVFLPKRSPTMAYRFIAIPLRGTATLCIICGSEPAFHEINVLAQQTFKNDFEMLENIERSMPRNFPESLEIDPNILGILLINRNYKKYVISRNLQKNSSGKRTMSGSHRLDILRTFYNHAVDVIEEFITDKPLQENGNEKNCKTKVLESYWCSEYHKCHALADDVDNLICVLYVASVPTYTMRLITQKTLAMILQEKTVCWQY